MTPEERIFSLMAIAEEQQKLIENGLELQQEAVRYEVERLRAAREELFNSYQSSLNEFTSSARVITQQGYSLFEWKSIIFGGLILLFIGALVLGGIVLYVNHAEDEVRGMQQAVEYLKWEGGEADVRTCTHDGSKYPCVRVMTSWGGYGTYEDYFILDPK